MKKRVINEHCCVQNRFCRCSFFLKAKKRSKNECVDKRNNQVLHVFSFIFCIFQSYSPEFEWAPKLKNWSLLTTFMELKVFCLHSEAAHADRALTWVRVARSGQVPEVVDVIQAVVVLHFSLGAQVGQQFQRLSTNLILSFCRHCLPASFWMIGHSGVSSASLWLSLARTGSSAKAHGNRRGYTLGCTLRALCIREILSKVKFIQIFHKSMLKQTICGRFFFFLSEWKHHDLLPVVLPCSCCSERLLLSARFSQCVRMQRDRKFCLHQHSSFTSTPPSDPAT